MSRTYAIADIHGRHDLLCRALSAIEKHSPEGGRLIILGDYIDRGPASAQVIDLLMAGPQLPHWKWDVLQGNHEAMMLEVLASPEPGNMHWWIANGGGATLRSYGYGHGDVYDMANSKVPTAHLHWLAGRPVYVEDAHRIYVHAGVPGGARVEDMKREILQWMLYEQFEDCAPADGRHVVHGHEQGPCPIILPHRTNLDCHAYASGYLCVGCFDDDTPGGPVLYGFPIEAGFGHAEVG